ncbi:MAG: HEAT repeat domain-containing protein [Planctomycetota bacterium]
MKIQLPRSGANRILLAVVLVGVAAGVVWLALFNPRAVAGRVVGRIYEGDATEAKEELRRLNDRAAALDALKETLQRRDGDVEGKRRILRTLIRWKESRVVQRAFDSDVPSTRRAVASIFFGHEDYREKATAICLDWLRDESAPGRQHALRALAHLEVGEALPYVEKILAGKPSDTELFRAALDSLPKLAPKKTAAVALRIARDETLASSLQLLALTLLRRAEDAPVEEVRDLLIAFLLDRSKGPEIRLRAALDLDDERYAGEKTWRALEQVLLEEETGDRFIVIPRHCLRALGRHLPLERLKKLLQDRRVYRHRYPFVCQDVAVGLAALGMDDKLSFDILCELLVHEDPKGSPLLRDRGFLVRQEAWLSLWSLFGRMYGVEEQELFRAPAPSTPGRPHEPFGGYDINRAGVDHRMLAAVKKHTGDLSHMQDVRQLYVQKWPDIKARLDRAREQAAAARKEEEEQKRKDEGAARPANKKEQEGR